MSKIPQFVADNKITTENIQNSSNELIKEINRIVADSNEEFISMDIMPIDDEGMAAFAFGPTRNVEAVVSNDDGRVYVKSTHKLSRSYIDLADEELNHFMEEYGNDPKKSGSYLKLEKIKDTSNDYVIECVFSFVTSSNEAKKLVRPEVKTKARKLLESLSRSGLRATRKC